MVEKKDYLFRDFPNLVITETMRDAIIANPQAYSSCDVRVRMGKVYTDAEKQAYIRDGLNRELPGGKQLCKTRRSFKRK